MPGKLTLDLDRLAIESFDTSEEMEQEGTVIGQECSCVGVCEDAANLATCLQTACRPYVCCA